MSDPYLYESFLKKLIENGKLQVVRQILELKPVPIDDRYLDYEFLATAMKAKHVDIVRFFIEEKNFRVNNPNINQYSNDSQLMLLAIQLGNLDLIKLLLSRGTHYFKCSVFEKIISEKKYEILQYFLSITDIELLNRENLLHCAVKIDDNATTLKILIKKGLSMERTDHRTLTPFCLAINNQKIRYLHILLSSFDISKVDSQKYGDIGPFFIASMTGNIQVLKKYIDHGLSVNTCLETAPDEPENIDSATTEFYRDWPTLGGFDKFTALHFAVRFNKIETVKFLLDQDEIDCGIRNANGLTPLHIAVQMINIELFDAVKCICMDIIEMLLAKNLVEGLYHYIFKLLCYAFLQGKYEIVDLFLSYDKIIDNTYFYTLEGLSLLHIASARNKSDLVRKLLEMKINVNEKSNEGNAEDEWLGYSPLHFAALFNHENIVELLLRYNAIANIKNTKGQTPLHIACQCNYEKFHCLIIDSLQSYRTRQSQTSMDEQIEYSVIHRCSSDELNSTAFISHESHWVSNRVNQIKIIKLLIESGNNIDDQDKDGCSSLFYAYDIILDNIMLHINTKQYEDIGFQTAMTRTLKEELRTRQKIIISILNQYNPDIEQCYRNNSILHYFVAKYSRNSGIEHSTILNVVESFLEKGANPNAADKTKQSLLHGAIKSRNEAVVSVLLKYNANVNSMSSNKSTPLHIAATCGQYEGAVSMTRSLLCKGANVNARNICGHTPLYLFSKVCKLNYDLTCSIMLNLLSSGAIINSQTAIKSKRTPLYLAMINKCPAAVLFLLYFGANVNIEDSKGKTVFCYAFSHMKKWISQIGELHGAEFETIKLLLQHYIKMKVIGLPLSEKVKSSAAKLAKKCDNISQEYDSYDDRWNYDYDDEEEEESRSFFVDGEERNRLTNEDLAEFSRNCEFEISRYKRITIDQSTSLYDIIFKSESEMVKYAKNEIFQQFLELEVYEIDDYRDDKYGYLLEMQYNKGVMKSKLIEFAKHALMLLASRHLPDLCSEYIFQYFTNEELQNFIVNVYSLYPEEHDLNSRFCLEMRKINHSYKFKLDRNLSHKTRKQSSSLYSVYNSYSSVDSMFCD